MTTCEWCHLEIPEGRRKHLYPTECIAALKRQLELERQSCERMRAIGPAYWQEIEKMAERMEQFKRVLLLVLLDEDQFGCTRRDTLDTIRAVLDAARAEVKEAA